jgi:pimeloyl-ACP methyl ester carboxylesterase
MLDGIGNRFIFPAPEPSYGPQSYKRHLCWIPWNEVISPKRAGDERCTDGIPCLWFPAPKAATVILFFHANAEDLGMSFAVLKHMRDQFKVNVLAVEYPGYGLLHHMVSSEDGVYEVALTAFRFLVDEVNVRYSQIILFGRSLGSGPAVYLAAQYPVGGLILVSAFCSIKGAVQSIAGRLVAWTWKERFPNNKIIANVSCSTLFIHGECDGLIPAEHSLRLFKRCRARKLLITPPKMEHNSNLFGDASFLAVPAIHFFGFPGYYTSTPPRLPAYLFENPERRARLRDQLKEESSLSQPWLCSCLAKSDPHHLDVTFCRQEHSVEDITIRFSETPADSNGTTTAAPKAEMDKTDDKNVANHIYSDFVSDQQSEDTTAPGVKEARRDIANFPAKRTMGSRENTREEVLHKAAAEWAVNHAPAALPKEDTTNTINTLETAQLNKETTKDSTGSAGVPLEDTVDM